MRLPSRQLSLSTYEPQGRLPMQKCGCNSMLQEKPGWMPSANHEFMQHMQFMLDLLAETNVLILPGFEKEKMG
ncbi:hypothetical protein EG328_000126 [Venturia inaequalis]|uniref:Uncharacterized protein n=1 Tax=Venturia inaequalis TaxID=5025 RepID=A0A8H3VHP6_VENIN|nr:hypothetical protein EG328_000126 [Venturia inaequalis]